MGRSWERALACLPAAGMSRKWPNIRGSCVKKQFKYEDCGGAAESQFDGRDQWALACRLKNAVIVLTSVSQPCQRHLLCYRSVALERRLRMQWPHYGDKSGFFPLSFSVTSTRRILCFLCWDFYPTVVSSLLHPTFTVKKKRFLHQTLKLWLKKIKKI